MHCREFRKYLGGMNKIQRNVYRFIANCELRYSSDYKLFLNVWYVKLATYAFFCHVTASLKKKKELLIDTSRNKSNLSCAEQ